MVVEVKIFELLICFAIYYFLPTYGTLRSVSNGTRYLLPTTYCIFCDFFGVKSNTVEDRI